MKKKKNEILDYSIIILLIVIFLMCLIGVLVYFTKGMRTEKQMEEVRNTYVTEGTQPITGQGSENQNGGTTTDGNENQGSDLKEVSYTTIDGVEYPDFSELDMPVRKIDIAGLRSQVNDDIYAWIYIPNTNVDYPILQHPSNNDYYLEHDMADKKVAAGSIFTQNYNSKDFNDNHTVIYGHNMKNGTMFKTLHYYMDKGFLEENPYIYIYLDGETRVYQIFGAYEYSDSHLLLNYDMEDDTVFANYIAEIEGLSDSVGFFDRELELSSEDKIITLSTCIGGKPDKRYLVQAKLIAVESD